MNSLSFSALFSPDEQQLLLDRLYTLLGGQSKKYLAGEHSSLPVETAEELLRSIVYTLRLSIEARGGTERDMLSGDLDTLLAQGQRLLQRKLTAVRGLWQRVCLTAPRIQNVYLKDSLSCFPDYFRHYDLRYFAHRVPADIDYPLCIPVAETVQGLSYAEQWLFRLGTEGRILSRFPAPAVKALLSRASPNYWDYPINLCEQPVICALGLALLGRSVLPLELSAPDCQRLSELLGDEDDPEGELLSAAAGVAAELRLPREAAYLNAITAAAAPRVIAMARIGDVSGAFLPK